MILGLAFGRMVALGNGMTQYHIVSKDTGKIVLTVLKASTAKAVCDDAARRLLDWYYWEER